MNHPEVLTFVLSSLVLLMMPQDSAAVTVYEDDEAAAISAVQQLITKNTGQNSEIQNISKTTASLRSCLLLIHSIDLTYRRSLCSVVLLCLLDYTIIKGAVDLAHALLAHNVRCIYYYPISVP